MSTILVRIKAPEIRRPARPRSPCHPRPCADPDDQGRIAYKLPVDFAEEDITCLEVGNSPVDEAPAGAQAGVKTSLVHQLRKGTKLYFVKSRRSKIEANGSP
jgi:hypothetical protein